MSSFTLKIIALVTMLLDHSTHVLYASGLLRDYGLYLLLRGIGRLAFPVYAFLLAEGFAYSRDRKKYLLRLMGFALIAQLPFSLCFADANYYAAASGSLSLELLYSWEALLLIIPLGAYLYLCGADKGAVLLAAFLLLPGIALRCGDYVLLDGEVSIFYTLAIGLSLLCCTERLRAAAEQGDRRSALPAMAAIVPLLLIIQPHADYALRGMALIFAFYMSRGRPWAQVLSIVVWSCLQYAWDMSPGMALFFAAVGVLLLLLRKRKWSLAAGLLLWALIAFRLTSFTFCVLMVFAALSALLILAYNSKPGKRLKILFYAAYPVHLLLLWIVFTFLYR